MRFTKIGCNNVTKCIIPPWVAGWNNVGKIQPAINVAAGVAHLAQSRPATKSGDEPQHQHQHRAERGNTGEYPVQTKLKTIPYIGNTKLSFYFYHPLNCLSLSSLELQVTSSSSSILCYCVSLASVSMSVSCNCFYPKHSSHAHANPILLGFRKNLKTTSIQQIRNMLLLHVWCLTSQLQHIVCPLSSLSAFFLSPMSVTSPMIPAWPPSALLRLNGTSFYVSDINFLSNARSLPAQHWPDWD